MNVFVLSALVGTLFWGLGNGQNGILMVENTDGSIRSRLGCMEVFVCSGMGTGIEWKRFGQRVELGNTANRVVTKSNEGELWRSVVTFDPVQETDRGVYTCSILGSQPSVTLTVILFVDPSPVEIDPDIGTIDISSYEERETATIACPVITCAENVVVTFLRGSEVVGVGTVDNTQTTVYNLNLLVTSETPGTYACKVDTVNPTDSIIQEFNITGTPMPPPTTAQPPDSTTAPGSTTAPDSSDASNGSPTGTGTGTTAASTTDSSALSMAMTGSFSLLVSLLVLAIVQIP